ncbi:calcium-activated chloride channel regulator 4-like [Branchiostoma floridae]|uniref:Calcium-activated chloride channel regulator 4-like n=1 Tax=Branchiostoma floridae TaxID=7739 RepID=A0A9J7M390_BRAFL|nr:calcium-activated chloride channel regulator 4-like [Branchiostoma floridae]
MASLTLRLAVLACVFICRTDVALTAQNVIQLQNNEYTDVLIAINRNIPEDQQIVDRLKEIFTEASEALYIATRSRAYIKQVKILIPNTWTRQPQYLPPGTATFDRANVRVDVQNPLYGDGPYVQQTGGCGVGGEYLHLTPRYVVDRPYGESNWGPYGKLVTHEWGHLRWGLFDEYGFDDPLGGSYPHFYVSTSMGIQPVRCSAYTAGSYQNPVTQSRCQVDPATGLPEADCRFIPNPNGNRATGSYMFMQFLPQVEEFCHGGQHLFSQGGQPNPLSSHNREAPNKQNALCNGQSAWDVMNKHQDFANGANPPREVVSTVPDFVLLQEKEPMMVLVLDTSGSMRVLEAQGDPSGGILFLMSDGQENELPDIATVTPQVLAKGIIIDTLAYKRSADPQIESLALLTGGKSYFYSGEQGDSTALNDAFTASVLSRDDRTGGEATIQLVSETKTLNTGENYYNELYIEKSEGRNAIFTFMWNGGVPPLIEIIAPNGTVIGQGDPSYHVMSDTIQVNVPGVAQPGKWSYNITIVDYYYQQVDILASCKGATPDSQPIKVTAQVSTISLNGSSLSESPALSIRASVTKGYLPVTGATVTAFIEKPPSEDVDELLLLDNGAGADVTKNDGVYSRHFLNFTAGGRYSVSVKVNNEQGEAASIVVTGTARRGHSAALSKDAEAFALDKNAVHSEPLDQFQRMAPGGVFELTDVPIGGLSRLDLGPPSRVNDLKVIRVSHDNLTVALSWTAVGDDLDQGGPAALTDLRFGRNFTELADDFEASSVVDDSQVLLGDLTSPSPPGTLETVVIRVPERGENVTFVFALRVCDTVGNCGQPSNIAAANLEYIPEPTTPPPTTPLSQPNKPNSNTLIIAVSVSCGVVAAVVAILAVLSVKHCCCKRKKRVSVTPVPDGIALESGQPPNQPLPKA